MQERHYYCDSSTTKLIKKEKKRAGHETHSTNENKIGAT